MTCLIATLFMGLFVIATLIYVFITLWNHSSSINRLQSVVLQNELHKKSLVTHDALQLALSQRDVQFEKDFGRLRSKNERDEW